MHTEFWSENVKGKGHHNFYSSRDIVRVIISDGDEMGGTCSMHVRNNKCVSNFIGSNNRNN